jgi:hypothetical protein
MNKFLFGVFLAFNFLYLIHSQIHRASNLNSYQIKYDSNFTVQYYLKKLASLNTDTLAQKTPDALFVWVSTVIGTFFVGICGILPVMLIPELVNDHQKLVNSSLFKCMAGFAAGSLLGDVFLHLLPESLNSTNPGE